MKNYTYLLIFFIASSFNFYSCDSEDLTNLSDVLYLRRMDADMPAYIHGNGEEKVFLIVLHGGPGDSGLVYRNGPMREWVERECAVVYFDQRSSGMSEGHLSRSEISIDIMADDVIALTQVIKHKYGEDCRFFLMGHSWGGTLGTAVMLKAQDIFQGWIEVDGGHNLTDLYFENINYFEEVAAQQIGLSNSVDYWNGVQTLINEVDKNKYNEQDAFKMNSEAFKAEGFLQDDEVIDIIDSDIVLEFFTQKYIVNNNLTSTITGLVVNNILTDKGLWTDTDYTDRLIEITIPSLVMWGRYDMVIPPTLGEQAFEKLGSADKNIRIFERSGHSPMFNQPNDFSDELRAFIREFK